MRNPKHTVAQVRGFGPLSFVFHPETECEGFSAICLELDIAGQGATEDEARRDLKEAIETYILHHLNTEQEVELRPAPASVAADAKREHWDLYVVTLKKRRREVVFSPPSETREFALN